MRSIKLSPFALIIILVSIFKLFLIWFQPMVSHSSSIHDDRMFVNHALSILSGHWLGTYSQFTLIKGPIYPMFLAFTYLTGLPVVFAQHLLYIFACFIVIIALRPIVKNQYAVVLLYIFLVFNPVTFDTETFVRLNRTAIYASEVLLTLACFIAIALRRNQKSVWIWTIFFGIISSLTLLTREEGLFLIIGYGFYFIAIMILSFRKGLAVILRNLLLFTVPVFIYIALFTLIGSLNYKYYGKFSVVEIWEKDQINASKSILKSTFLFNDLYITAPPKARQLLYEASPTFSQLKPDFEGYLGLVWAYLSTSATGKNPQDRIIGSSWFMLAMRDMMQKRGYFINAQTSGIFLRNVSAEIENACQEKKLACAPYQISVFPYLRFFYLPRIIYSTLKVLVTTVSFVQADFYPKASGGLPDGHELFKDFSGWWNIFPLTTSQEDFHDLSQHIINMNYGYYVLLFGIKLFYCICAPLLFLFSFISSLSGMCQSYRQKKVSVLVLIQTTVLICIFVFCLMLGMIDAMIQPIIRMEYPSGVVPCILLFCLTGPYYYLKKSHLV